MENRETKKPNDPLLCRKKEALKCQKNTDNEFEKEKRKKQLGIFRLVSDCYLLFDMA